MTAAAAGVERANSSLRFRLTAGFFLTLAAVLLLFGAGLVLDARRVERRDREDLLRAAAREVRLALSKETPGFDPGNAEERAELRIAEDDLAREYIRVTILGSDGRVVYQAAGGAVPWPPRRGDGWRSASLPAGEDTIVVGLSTARFDDLQRRQLVYFVLFGLSVAAIATVGAWVLVDRTLAPIRSLAREAQSFADNAGWVGVSTIHEAPRLHTPSHDAELVELVHTFNTLIERIIAEGAAKGRFYAAASHELRTPLQALAGQVELALSRPREAHEYRRSLEKADGQARRLMELVNSLLLLNRIESDDTPPPAEPTDVAALCREDLEQLQPMLEQRGLTVEAALPEEALALGPPAHIDILVRNLLENAVKYAIPGTRMRIGWSTEAGRARFEVFNAVAEEARDAFDDLVRLFEPFYRSPAARKAFPAGNGLGLPLVKALADRNGWQVTPILKEEGVTFRVEMPAG